MLPWKNIIQMVRKKRYQDKKKNCGIISFDVHLNTSSFKTESTIATVVISCNMLLSACRNLFKSVHYSEFTNVYILTNDEAVKIESIKMQFNSHRACAAKLISFNQN